MARTQNERAVIDLVINGQSAKTTLKEVSLEVTRTRSALLKMKEADNPAAYAEKLAQMHKLIDAQRQMKARIDDTTSAWGRFKTNMGQVATGVVGGNIMTAGLQALVGLIPSTIDRTMKLKDAFADIEKATGLSTQGVEKLNKELKNIDTRTTNQELRDIAVAGGQLGVANDQLLDFVKNTDMAVVALGDEFTGGVEQVAKEIGGLGKLFKETRDQEIGQNINQIGSALNDLGAAGAATSPVVAEFATRIGQLGGLAPTISETLGLGAALQELGLTSEIASSGLSGLLLTAASKSELFAQQLKMSKTELEALMNRSPNEFLMKLAKSFEGLSATQVAQRLKELKVESQESIKVMSLLADQTDFVKQKQDLAAKSMAKGTSLAEEAAKKNHQLALDLKALNEWFNSLLSSPALQEFLVSAIHNTVEFVKVLPQVGKWLSENKTWFGALATATLVYNGVLIQTTLSTVAATAAELYRKAAYELGFRWLVIQTTASRAYSLATGVLTGQITLQTAAVTIARAAWAGLSAVMLANPIGVIIAGLTALAYAVKLYSDNTEKALRIEREKLRLQRDMQLLTEVQSRTLAKLNEQMQDYNQMNQAERAEYVKNVAVARMDLEARLTRMKAREKEMEMLALEPSLWQKLWAAIKAGGNISLMAQNLTQQGAANVVAVREQFASSLTGIQEDLSNYDRIIAQIQRAERPQGGSGGGTLPTIKDPDKKPKKDKAATDAKHDAEELEKMLADSRKTIMAGEESDYEKEVAQFAAKYTRMYELAKNNQAKIDEIRRLSLLEFAEIDKKRQDKEDADRQKQTEEDNKVGFDAALSVPEEQRTNDKATNGQFQANHQFTEQDVKLRNLQADEQYYIAKLTLEQAFAQDSADTMRELTETQTSLALLHTEQDTEASNRRIEQQQREFEARRHTIEQLYGVLQNDWSQTLSGMKSYWKDASLIQKTAFLIQRGYALGEIAIHLAKQIILINTAGAVMDAILPGSGLAFRIKGIAQAVGTAALQGAAIASINPKTPAFADGGFTGSSDGPSGFVDSPTLFSVGKRSYVAGEAGREFVISNRALQDPVVADFARIMDVAQKSGNYGMLAVAAAAQQPQTVNAPAPTSSGSKGAGNTESMLMLAAGLKRVEDAINAQGSKPVDFNYRIFEQYKDRVTEIRNVTSL